MNTQKLDRTIVRIVSTKDATQKNTIAVVVPSWNRHKIISIPITNFKTRRQKMIIPVEAITIEFHDLEDRIEYLVFVEITNLYLGRVYKSKKSLGLGWRKEGSIRPNHSRLRPTMYSHDDSLITAIQCLINNHAFENQGAICQKIIEAEEREKYYFSKGQS